VKKVFKTIGGILVVLIDLYSSFYIGLEALPKDWITSNVWWAVPTSIVLVGGGVSLAILGIFMAVSPWVDKSCLDLD
jgi:hypothetical protein